MTAHASAGSTGATTVAGFGTDSGTRWTRAAALSGVLFAALLVAGTLLTMSSPSDGASSSSVTHYYTTHRGEVNGSALLITLSVVVGLGFFSYLRTYLRRITGLDWLPAVFFTGCVIFGISGAVGAGINFTLGDKPKLLSPDSLVALNQVSQNLSWAILVIGLTIVYAALGMVIVRTRILPTWVAWLSWLMTLLAASFFLSFVPLIAVPLWVIVVSIRLAMRNPSLGTTA